MNFISKNIGRVWYCLPADHILHCQHRSLLASPQSITLMWSVWRYKLFTERIDSDIGLWACVLAEGPIFIRGHNMRLLVHTSAYWGGPWDICMPQRVGRAIANTGMATHWYDNGILREIDNVLLLCQLASSLDAWPFAHRLYHAVILLIWLGYCGRLSYAT